MAVLDTLTATTRVRHMDAKNSPELLRARESTKALFESGGGDDNIELFGDFAETDDASDGMSAEASRMFARNLLTHLYAAESEREMAIEGPAAAILFGHRLQEIGLDVSVSCSQYEGVIIASTLNREQDDAMIDELPAWLDSNLHDHKERVRGGAAYRYSSVSVVSDAVTGTSKITIVFETNKEEREQAEKCASCQSGERPACDVRSCQFYN